MSLIEVGGKLHQYSSYQSLQNVKPITGICVLCSFSYENPIIRKSFVENNNVLVSEQLLFVTIFAKNLIHKMCCILLGFQGANDDDDDEERWGDDLCSRYDQESQFLSARPDYDNIVSSVTFIYSGCKCKLILF